MKWTVTKHSIAFFLSEAMKIVKGKKDGEVFILELKKKPKRRTNDQNSYLWGVVYPHLLMGLLEAGWEFTDTEQVHEFFKQVMSENKVVNRNTGEVLSLPNSTAAMSSSEFSVYVDKLKEYGSEYLGITIPEAI